MTHTSDKLREEFLARFTPEWWKGFGTTYDIDRKGIDSITDWWLSKLETAIKDRESELAEKIKKLERTPKTEETRAKEIANFYNFAIYDILSLLHTDTNSKE